MKSEWQMEAALPLCVETLHQAFYNLCDFMYMADAESFRHLWIDKRH